MATSFEIKPDGICFICRRSCNNDGAKGRKFSLKTLFKFFQIDVPEYFSSLTSNSEVTQGFHEITVSLCDGCSIVYEQFENTFNQLNFQVQAFRRRIEEGENIPERVQEYDRCTAEIGVRVVLDELVADYVRKNIMESTTGHFRLNTERSVNLSPSLSHNLGELVFNSRRFINQLQPGPSTSNKSSSIDMPSSIYDCSQNANQVGTPMQQEQIIFNHDNSPCRLAIMPSELHPLSSNTDSRGEKRPRLDSENVQYQSLKGRRSPSVSSTASTVETMSLRGMSWTRENSERSGESVRFEDVTSSSDDDGDYERQYTGLTERNDCPRLEESQPNLNMPDNLEINNMSGCTARSCIIYTCNECKNTYKSRATLSNHVKSCQPVICRTCGVHFIGRNRGKDLEEHVNTHGIRDYLRALPVVTTELHMNIAVNNARLKHCFQTRDVVSGEEVGKCRLCRYQCWQMCELNVHMKQYHIDKVANELMGAT